MVEAGDNSTLRSVVLTADCVARIEGRTLWSFLVHTTLEVEPAGATRKREEGINGLET